MAPLGSFHLTQSHQLFEYPGLMLLTPGQHEGHWLALPFHPQVNLGAKAPLGAA
jgi:hypothetical protein